jgi:hypothetical protein
MSNTTKPTPTGRIMLKNVRLSFPGLFEATAFKPGDKPKYKATFLIPKDSPLAKQVDALIKKTFLEKYPKKAAVLEQIKGNPNKFCWQDGDTKDYDGYAGMMALSCKSDVRPTVLDEKRNPVTAEDGKVYAGCYVNASVDLFAYDSSGVGMSAQVRGVQFAAAGDAFAAGRPADSDEFDEVTEGADAGDFA